MIGIKLAYLTLLMKIESYTYFIVADINSTVYYTCGKQACAGVGFFLMT